MKIIYKISIAIFLLIFPLLAFAHQPRVVGSQNIIQVQNPEISQAFYAVLEDKPQIYEIGLEEPFTLYVGLLAPQIKNASTTKDFSAYVYQEGEYGPKLLNIIAGPKFQWAEFHEPFANDDYLKGPEFRQEVGAGKYFIKIVSPCHSDFAATLPDCGPEKYVLVIGEKEEFWLSGIVDSVFTLPKVKKFFNRSFLTAYFNLIGALLAGALIIIAALIFLARKLFKKMKSR